MDRLSFKVGELRVFIEQVQKILGLNSDELAKLVGLSGRTIRDWKREKYRPAKDTILKLSRITGVGLPEYKIILWEEHIKHIAYLGGRRRYELYGLLGTREDRAKGGRMCWLKRKNCPELWNKHTNLIVRPELSANLAEFVGIMLGDGSMTHFQCLVYLNSETDQEFAHYVRVLIDKLFGIIPRIHIHKKYKMLKISVSAVNLVEYLRTKGLSLGNKVHLQVGVPNWVLNKPEYIKACIRGLVDTDGCFALHKYKVNGREYCYPKICFSNRSEPLLKFVYQGLLQFGFNPKRTYEHEVWLHNQNEVRRYLKEIGTNNLKPSVKKILGGVA